MATAADVAVQLRFDSIKPKIGARVLNTKEELLSGALSEAILSLMEERGVLTRRVMPTSPPSVEYELTELGREFMPVIQAIMDVGHRLKTRAEEAREAA